jgi:hypothetical protein
MKQSESDTRHPYCEPRGVGKVRCPGRLSEGGGVAEFSVAEFIQSGTASVVCKFLPLVHPLPMTRLIRLNVTKLDITSFGTEGYILICPPL